MAHPEPLISVKGLTKAFGHTQALNDLSFEVTKGALCGFLGPNGSGKSTTIRIMLSLVKPDQGKASIFGKDISKSRKEILRRVGALIERPDFYEHLSGSTNLKLLSAYGGVKLSANRLSELLATVGLDGRGDDHVGNYSDGMKQRLGIAQALINDPELLILDEPFNSLDPQGVKDVRELLIDLNTKKGVTILISSHKLEEIERMADQMILISSGKAVASGSLQELVHHVINRISISTDDNLKAIEKLKGAILDLEVSTGNDEKLIINCSKEYIPEIVEILTKNGISIYQVTPDQSLESLFLKYTQA